MALNYLPSCYRFDPTDEELMQYLYKKVHRITLPSSAVLDCDLYGKSDAWKKLFDETGENTLYFFTELKKVGPSRIDRTTGSGTWRSQHDREVYTSSGGGHTQLIGYKKTFTFVPREKDEEKGRWVMHEYRLDEALLTSCIKPNHVVCRIKRKTKREERRRISEADAWSLTSWSWDSNECFTAEEIEALMATEEETRQILNL